MQHAALAPELVTVQVHSTVQGSEQSTVQVPVHSMDDNAEQSTLQAPVHSMDDNAEQSMVQAPVQSTVQAIAQSTIQAPDPAKALSWKPFKNPFPPQQEKPGDVTVMSADDVEVTISDRSRIVTLGGAITETVYALGYGDQLIASDQSSTYPEEVFRKPRLTVFRTSTPESILSLNPSLILTTEGIRPLSVPTQLRNAGVPTLLLKEAKTPEEAAERMRKIGHVLGEEKKAEEIVRSMFEDLDRAYALQKELPRKPRVLFVYTRGAYMVNVTGSGTSADAVIRLAGGINVVDQFEGYRPLTAEAVVTSAPDLILVPEFGLEMLGGMAAFLNQPGISLTPAAKNGHILAIDDAMLLSFGPRLGEGVYQLTSEMIRVLEEKP